MTEKCNPNDYPHTVVPNLYIFKDKKELYILIKIFFIILQETSSPGL